MTSKPKTIVDRANGINPGSKLVAPDFIPGKTNFLGSTQDRTIDKYRTKAFNNQTYNGVVIECRKVEKNSAIGALAEFLLITGEDLIIRVRIPGLHEHLPDPFKFPNQSELLSLYPVFTGTTKELGGSKPPVGSIVSVTFVDNNNKFTEFGNGKIVSIIEAAVNGTESTGGGPASGRSSRSGPNSPLPNYIKNPICKLLAVNAPVPYSTDVPEEQYDVGRDYRLNDREYGFLLAQAYSEERSRAMEVDGDNLSEGQIQAYIDNELDKRREDSRSGRAVGDRIAKTLGKGVKAFARRANWVYEVLRPSVANAGELDALESGRRANREWEATEQYYNLFKDRYGQVQSTVGAQERPAGPDVDPDSIDNSFEKPPMNCNDASTIDEIVGLIEQYGLEVPDQQLEYPRWPTIFGGVDVNTGRPTAGAGQPGRITSFMQAKRKITANGSTTTRNHNGIDIGIATGTPCLAILDGVVVKAENTSGGGGATIVIKHNIGGGKFVWAGYCHMRAILVEPGSNVKRGQCVGLSGGKAGDWGAGRSTGAHLHFQIALKRPGAASLSDYANPLKFFSTKVQNLPNFTGGL